MRVFSRVAPVLILGTLVSCATVPETNGVSGAVNPALCSSVEQNYIYSYERALKDAEKLDVESCPFAAFVLGEAHFLRGDDRRAFNYLLPLVSNTDGTLALAVIRMMGDMHLSSGQMRRLADAPVSDCGFLCRTALYTRKKEAARKLGMDRLTEEIAESDGFIDSYLILETEPYGGYSSLETVSETERRFQENKSFDGGTRLIKMPSRSDRISLSNYIYPLTNSNIYLYRTFSLEKAGRHKFGVRISAPHRVYIDGKMILEVREPGEAALFGSVLDVNLSEGDHAILVKISTYEEERVDVAAAISGNPQISGPISQYDGTVSMVKGENQPSSLTEEYLGIIGRELYEGGYSAKGLESFYARTGGSRSAPILFALAQAYADEDPAYFENLMEFLVKHYVGFTRFRTTLVDYLHEEGRQREAYALLDQALENEKERLVFLLALNDVYYMRRLYRFDVETGTKVIEKYPNYLPGYIYLSDAYAGMGNVEKALLWRGRALDLFPFDMELLRGLDSLYRESAMDEGRLEVMKRLLRILPDDMELHARLGALYNALGEHKKAEKILRRGLKLNPSAPTLHEVLADTLLFVGRKKEAFSLYRKASLLNPQSETLWGKMDFIEEGSDSSFFKSHGISDGDVLERIQRIDTEPYRALGHHYVILFDEGLQRLFHTGFIRSHYRMAVKVLDSKGAEEFSRVELLGKLRNARIIRANGSVDRRWKADRRYLYTDKLEPGDTLDYTMELNEEQHAMKGGIHSRWFFGMTGVYNIESRLTMLVPDEMDVDFYSRGDIKSEKESVSGLGTVHRFKAEETYLPPREAGMIPMIDVVPMVSYSTLNSWSQFSAMVRARIRRLSSDGKGMGTLVKGVTADDETVLDKVRSLRNFVSTEIDYVHDERGFEFSEIRPVKDTFDEKSGTSREKALLLRKLLNTASVRADYALVKTRKKGSLIKELPYMQFNYVLLHIPKQEGIERGFFIDPISSYDNYRALNPVLEGAEALVITDDSYRFEKVGLAEENSVKIRIEHGTGRIQFSGMAASLARFHYFSRGGDEGSVGSFLSLLGIKSDSVKPADDMQMEPLIVRFRTSSFSFPKPANMLFSRLIEPEKRSYPFFIENAAEEYTFKISGKDRDLKPFSLDNPYFFYIAEFRGSELKVVFRLKRKVVPGTEYGEFQKQVRKLISFENSFKDF